MNDCEQKIINAYRLEGRLPDTHPSPLTVFRAGDRVRLSVKEDDINVISGMLEFDGKWFTIEEDMLNVRDSSFVYTGCNFKEYYIYNEYSWAWFNIDRYVPCYVNMETVEEPCLSLDLL